DKRKRPARHERLAWATSRTRLPIIANGDVAGAQTLSARPAAFDGVAGVMIGRHAIVQPWIFAGWERRLEIDPGAVWLRLHDYVGEDFEPDVALKRVRLFTKYFARNFHFGHAFHAAVGAAPTMAAARTAATRFFETQPARHAEASVLGL